ncbi:hypothetical protein [Flavobacterium lipolyticum]|uniref:Lipocalin-like domain-containing protein n=1 Tax=Flavobacterium lipolyticum TaxID=2893754 RepID=A0ABS8LVC9_9FLAO|nr:hypothetical protein [Flavobacterium sp. F-126]MCC9016479.1 hypothetical protein [Flavobacterium sp. F-126]
MTNKILLLPLFFILISCKNRDELGLTNPVKKWVYFDSDKKFDKDSIKFLTYLKFDANGKCVNLFFSGNQYNSSMDWKFTKDDSILKISDKRFLVQKIYKDSILMKDLKYNRPVKMLNWSIVSKEL